MAFDPSAIEDDGGTNMKTNDVDSTRILRSLLHKSVLVGRTSCFTCNINAPASNTDAILSQYKSKYSKDTLISI